MSQLLKLLDDTPYPAFDLNFLGGMPGGLTYTNSSTERVYWDSTGTRRSAVANEPIFETLNGVAMGMRWEMEARTNLATNSEGAAATWSVSNVSDAGTPIAGFSASLQFGDNSVLRTASKTVSVTSGVSYTASVFIQMDDGLAPVIGSSTVTGDMCLVLSAGGIFSGGLVTTRVAGNIYRVSGLRTATSTVAAAVIVAKYTTQSARTFRVIGIQVEAAASASSYIPTAGSSVIRQPDVLTATSISPWYRQDEGTVVFEGILTDATVTGRGLFAFSDGTNNERIGGYVGLAASNSSFFCVDGGVVQADLTTMGIVTQNSVFRYAGAYRLNDFAGVLNAGTVRNDTSGTIATANQLRLGAVNAIGANPFMGYARRLQYYNTRLTNSQLQGLSRV